MLLGRKAYCFIAETLVNGVAIKMRGSSLDTAQAVNRGPALGMTGL